MRGEAFDGAVVISPFFWNFRDDMWQTTHQIARELSRLYPTVFVEPNVPWNFTSEQFRAGRLRQSLLGRRVSCPEDNLFVFHRRGVPFGRFGAVKNFDLDRNARALRQMLQARGFGRILLWHSFPYGSIPLVEAVDYAAFVYHCLDESTQEEEARLVRRADVVFSVSETLVEKQRGLNPHSYLLPNGVDTELFNPGVGAKKPRPDDLPDRGRLLGFVGSINCHVDLELLLETACAFPNDHLILIGQVLPSETAPRGPQRGALEELQKRPNVHLLGFKPPRGLPPYLSAFDVCLIPFLDNPFNRGRDPLKFYQYIAMGKPVVATRSVTVAARYPDLCYAAGSAEDFLRAIRSALSEGESDRRVSARVNMARAHSWPSLVRGALSLLSTKLGTEPETEGAHR